MDYEFASVADGTLYRNSLTVGARGRVSRAINPYIRKFLFDEARGLAWVKHNIEEVGNLESFLPELYATENCADPRSERILAAPVAAHVA